MLTIDAPIAAAEEGLKCPDFYQPVPKVRPAVEAWTPQRRTQARLDRLEALGSRKAIALYLRRIGIVGNHHAASCPVARFIQRDNDGLMSAGVTVTHNGATIYMKNGRGTKHYNFGPNIHAFVRSFDGGRFRYLRI